jgi:hypothetical protein
MAQVANLKFVDGDSGEQGLVLIRVEGNLVGLALSLLNNGDIEVFVDAHVLDEIIQALGNAREMIGPGR